MVAGVILVLAIIRVRFLGFPLERDEGEYAYAGQLLLQGIPPYEMAYNMKLPGAYFAYALFMAVFGQTPIGIHIGLLLVNAVSIVLVYALGKRLFNAGVGVVGAVSYAWLSLSPSVLGVSGHATHFVVVFALAGLLLLLRANASGRMGTYLVAGCLLGLAFLMKQHAIFVLLFGVAVAVRPLWRASSPRRLRMLAAVTLLGGCALPFVATCAYLLAAGVFDQFWFWTVVYARDYVSQVPWSEAPQRFLAAFWPVVYPYRWLWALAGAGLIGLCVGPRWRSGRTFLLTLLGASWLTILPGFLFRQHYFIVVLPAVGLLAGVGVDAFVQWLSRRSIPSVVRQALPVVLLLLVWGWPLRELGAFYFAMPMQQASRILSGENPFPESMEIATYIRAHSSEADTMAVLGSEPQIAFYAKRRSATGYLYTYALMESHAHAREMQQKMIAEIESAQPKFLVFVNIPKSWLARRDSPTLMLNWYPPYAREHYDLVGLVDIVSASQTEYRWDAAVGDKPPKSPFYVLVYARKSASTRGQPDA